MSKLMDQEATLRRRRRNVSEDDMETEAEDYSAEDISALEAQLIELRRQVEYGRFKRLESLTDQVTACNGRLDQSTTQLGEAAVALRQTIERLQASAAQTEGNNARLERQGGTLDAINGQLQALIEHLQRLGSEVTDQQQTLRLQLQSIENQNTLLGKNIARQDQLRSDLSNLQQELSGVKAGLVGNRRLLSLGPWLLVVSLLVCVAAALMSAGFVYRWWG